MSRIRMPLCVRMALPVLLLASLAAGQAVPEILYYKFDEGSGTNTANLALPAQGSPNPFISGHQLSASGGQFGGSLLGVTNGSGNNQVNTGWVTNLGSGSWTIGFWIHLHGATSNGSSNLMYVFGDPTAGSFRCFINSSAGAGGLLMRGPLNELGSNGSPLLSGGHYVHYVYNAATTSLQLYIDGTLNASNTQPGGLSINGTGAFQVAGYTGNSAESLRNGVNLDEFRVYNRALTASEISQTWNLSLTPVGLFADFTSNTTTGPTPSTINFQDTSTTSEPGGITSWLWDFGDGTTSTQQDPSHTYTTMGSFTVSLTVTDGVNPPSTKVRTDFITTGEYLFDIQTSGGGVGDLVLTAAPPPPGTTEGYTLFSTTPAPVLGQGNFFGIMFDPFVLTSLTSPAFVGNPFHWLPDPNAYPTTTFSVPPGVLTQYAGVTADGVVIYIVNGQIETSQVARATF